MNKIKLGNEVKDIVTGFAGIVTAKVKYLTGCTQFGVTPKTLSDGKINETNFFDEGRLEKIGDGITKAQVEAPETGGPQRDQPTSINRMR